MVPTRDARMGSRAEEEGILMTAEDVDEAEEECGAGAAADKTAGGLRPGGSSC
jgi:hypothetical protein